MGNRDPNFILMNEGEPYVRAHLDNELQHRKSGTHNGVEQRPDGSLGERQLNGGLLQAKLRLRFFNEVKTSSSKNWLIKNVIALGEMSTWIARPGAGKSALLTDLSIHLAGGSIWRGYRTKRAMGVVYFALERADLVARRFRTYSLRDKIDDLPIAIAGQVIDLMKTNCVEVITNAIRETEGHYSCSVGLAIFDTYAKGIAAGGGDENAAKDQNIALANLRRVIDETGVHIATIGHTGKDESRGERGSNAKLADVDVEVQIKGEDIKDATVTKANDQPLGPLTSFTLEPYDLEPDEDGDQFRTYILSGTIPDVATVEGKKLTDKQRLAIDALTEVLLSDDARSPPSEYGLPKDTKVVPAQAWLNEMYRRQVLDCDAKGHRARYGELRQSLQAKYLIGVRDDFVWDARRKG
jgi:AAA domain